MNKKKGVTMVFVTNQRRCVRLIELGAKIARQSDTTLTVLHVDGGNWPADPEGLQYLFDHTADQGGEMRIIYAEHPLEEMEKAIEEEKPNHVVTGAPVGPQSIVYRLQEKFTDCVFYSISPEEIEQAQISSPQA